jgi:PST family polysaccharide transporter
VALALYRMAERLMQLVIELSVRPVAQVALPNFARLQGEPAALRKGVVTTLKSSAIFGIPALAGLAAVSVPLIALLGEEWRPSAPALQILCVLGAARSLTLFTGSLLQAVGRPGLLAAMQWSLAAVNIAAFTAAGAWLRDFAVLDQVRGIAAVRTGIFALLYVPTNLALLLSFSGNTIGRLLRALLPSLLGAATALLAVAGVRTVLSGAALPEVVALLAQVAVGAVLALAALYAIDADFRYQAGALLERVRGRTLAEPIPRQERD